MHTTALCNGVCIFILVLFHTLKRVTVYKPVQCGSFRRALVEWELARISVVVASISMDKRFGMNVLTGFNAAIWSEFWGDAFTSAGAVVRDATKTLDLDLNALVDA